MAHAAQRKVQEEIQGLIEELDRSGLRDLQGNMHRCAATCCDNSSASLEDVHHCVSRCGEDMAKAQGYVQRELSLFQGKLERCALDCQDKIREKVTAETSEAAVEGLRGQYEDCVVRCVDTQVGLIPAMMKRMQEVLRKKSYPNI
jgi:type I site-specific restriction endonuclease